MSHARRETPAKKKPVGDYPGGKLWGGGYSKETNLSNYGNPFDMTTVTAQPDVVAHKPAEEEKVSRAPAKRA